MALRRLALASCLAGALALPALAQTQDYPTKNIRFISPFRGGA
jgi:tripartite-type tricarboxylate transporter receptor subunit TctC